MERVYFYQENTYILTNEKLRFGVTNKWQVKEEELSVGRGSLGSSFPVSNKTGDDARVSDSKKSSTEFWQDKDFSTECHNNKQARILIIPRLVARCSFESGFSEIFRDFRPLIQL